MKTNEAPVMFCKVLFLDLCFFLLYINDITKASTKMKFFLLTIPICSMQIKIQKHLKVQFNNELTKFCD